jgi:hypothetical protein
MIHPKQLLLITTFMLGSCVPLTPQPSSITIYNTIEARSDKDVKTQKVVTCQSGDTYIIPDKPSLDDLEDGDDQGVVDRLNDHIDFLRDELKNLAAKGKCGK